jgi:hypothetical protein
MCSTTELPRLDYAKRFTLVLPSKKTKLAWRCSNETKNEDVWTRQDLNPLPPRCKRGALPDELLARIIYDFLDLGFVISKSVRLSAKSISVEYLTVKIVSTYVFLFCVDKGIDFGIINKVAYTVVRINSKGGHHVPDQQPPIPLPGQAARQEARLRDQRPHRRWPHHHRPHLRRRPRVSRHHHLMGQRPSEAHQLAAENLTPEQRRLLREYLAAKGRSRRRAHRERRRPSPEAERLGRPLPIDGQWPSTSWNRTIYTPKAVPNSPNLQALVARGFVFMPADRPPTRTMISPKMLFPLPEEECTSPQTPLSPPTLAMPLEEISL